MEECGASVPLARQGLSVPPCVPLPGFPTDSTVEVLGRLRSIGMHDSITINLYPLLFLSLKVGMRV